MSWGGVGEEALSFLEDVIAERVRLADHPVGWRGNGVLHLENTESERM